MSIELFGTPEQEEIIYCPYKYIGFFCGRRYGKTISFKNRAIKKCLENPGFKYLYLAPTHPTCNREFGLLANNRELRKVLNTKDTVKQPFTVVFNNGSVIELKNVNIPDNLRQTGYDEVWCDEIQSELYHEEMFFENIRTLVGDKRGSIVVSGQFRGENWYYDLFVKKAKHGKPNHFCRIYSTDTGLMYQSDAGKAEYKDAEENTPTKIFRQEWKCKPDGNLSSVFDLAHINNIIIRNQTDKLFQEWCQKKPGKVYFMAIDTGGKVDHEGICVLELDPKEIQTSPRKVVHAEMFKRGLDHAVMAKMCQKIRDKYDAKVVADASGGGAGGATNLDKVFATYLNAIPGMRDFYWGKGNKDRVIRYVDLSIQYENVLIPERFKELTTQMCEYEFKHKGGDRYEYSAPKGKHDDALTAFMLALWGTECKWHDISNPNLKPLPRGF